MGRQNTKMILLRIYPQLKEELQDIAQEEKRTLSSLLVKVLYDYSKSYQLKQEAKHGAAN